jgi:glycosyltransferase involved in cell wall biosynthesis
VLALSAIADDPRVRRQGDGFHQIGWRVFGVGLPGGRSALPEWPILAENQPSGSFAADRDRHEPRKPPSPGAAESVVTGIANYLRKKPRLRRLASMGWRLLGRCMLLLVRVRPGLAEKMFWADMPPRELHALAGAVEADIWLANDWTALPIVARLAREKGGIYGYDTHEFATEEYAEKRAWRLWHRPLVRALEGKFIREAKVVSAVSTGIARRLDELYSLPRPTIVVRNTPQYECRGFRPTGERIRVLYHGIIVPGRGLEIAIDSVAQWRTEFELTLRGPENPEFTPALRARIAARSLDGRVVLAPAVPMTELVQEASAFDIGFFALPGHSRHNEFALPNKIFEYIMAGLCLCMTELPEIAGLIREYELGVTIPTLDPAAIAVAINRLDRDRIDNHKRNALIAARELCWERESEKLLASYAACLRQPGLGIPA